MISIKEYIKIRELSFELLDKFFPKLNEDNTSIASPNNRGTAMAMIAVILAKIKEGSK